MISIGDNVTISADVVFITHDNSCIKINPKKSNLFGRICIGDNCFIGQRSTILYGVTLANNIIVASGSVVTKSFDTERVVIGGNPAKIITTWEDYEVKNAAYMMTRAEFADAMLSHDESRLVVKSPYRPK
ncbi:acyltransferase [Parabacteroides sp. ZJ-118]|uniref:acyltransferase n=1 Tax=Parabacteroides sp. ZJ-118 TaxID=2709398 RepID=UPI00197FD285|nr:acyltransferase [Parabacteroides sp. ZJ-118]